MVLNVVVAKCSTGSLFVFLVGHSYFLTRDSECLYFGLLKSVLVILLLAEY